MAGPRVDVLISSKSHKFGFIAQSFYDDLRNVSLGADIGIGTKFDLNEMFTSIFEIRYSHDFTNSFNSDVLEAKNQSFEFLLGIGL